MDAMQTDHQIIERQMESYRKVIDKFYAIRQQSLTFHDEVSWGDKCEYLLHDSAELWVFNCQEENSASKYIRALEQEVETLRRSADNHQNNLRMGVEIENHLKRKVHILEKEKENSQKAMSALLDYHFKHKVDVISLLDECGSFIKSTVREMEEKITQFELRSKQDLGAVGVEYIDTSLDENECRDVHVNNEAGVQRDEPGLPAATSVSSKDANEALAEALQENVRYSDLSKSCHLDASEALAQALQEKVATLLLLSQEEERYLLERNVNVALQRKVEELQRNLFQVTHEKVKALMELAKLKQEHQKLQEKINQEFNEGKSSNEISEKRISQERDGRLKNLLKKTYLRQWVEKADAERDAADSGGDASGRKSSHEMVFARIKIENAALKESLESMEHLTSTVRKLHLAFLKTKESAFVEGAHAGSSETLDDIINEAKLVKTALGSSLPISWSGTVDLASQVDRFQETANATGPDGCNEKVDAVSAAGFEMVQLLISAAETWKEHLSEKLQKTID